MPVIRLRISVVILINHNSAVQLPVLTCPTCVSDLTALLDHNVMSIGRDEYILFDVPADHHCLFHSISGVLKLLYTTSRHPTAAEVRAAVITFYRT